ncbi:carbohydrate kinase family protein [Anaerostipes sp.]|uniref:carbohydrate kinase family protein n=1 Tax=Anaerostipes sp. TaxID=1872530 RepID=UPI0025C1CAA2|nr:carbohydrate kinase family protein [Anaerostipes sp.]MBS7009001.1 carbohydrate kinase family protein [Anaerostipes sp.]
MKKVVVAGCLCLDITPEFHDSREGEKKSAAEWFLPGKLMQVGEASIHTGGAVANTGLAFRHFGADVSLMGKVGDDAFGKLVLDLLDRHGGRQGAAVSKDCSTAYTVVLAPPGIDRIFFHNPGANDVFGLDDLDFEEIAQADLFHLGYPTIMRRMFEHPDELVEIFSRVKELGVKTSLDLTAIEEDSDAAKADWPALLQELLPKVDFFVPSAEEICFLIDRDRYDQWMERASGGDLTEYLEIENDIRPLADRLLTWGAGIVLIKCGIKGLYLKTGKSQELPESWQDIELFEPSYQAERVRSATGAGDVSIAAFLTALLEGKEPGRCLSLAAAAGACCVTEYDSLSGLLTMEEMEEKIDQGWEKNNSPVSEYLEPE